jgi:hypothetical protein
MEQIIEIITGIISCASIVAAITPGQRDNIILDKIMAFVNLLAVNVGNAKNKD